MDTLLNLQNNLIQNFYIIGLSPSKFCQISEDNKPNFLNIFKDPFLQLKPEIISKFPPQNGNFNSINDDIVLSHCFPQEFKIIKDNEEQKQFTHFEFSLDNILFNYNEEDKKLYSKIYFTCLEFYESLELYNNFKKEILNSLTLNKTEKSNINKLPFETNSSYLKQYIPKIICFASLLPFTKELTHILSAIYYTYSVKFCDNSILPIEKFIEQIVLSIPIPLTINKQIDISFKFGTGEKSNSKYGERKTVSSTAFFSTLSHKENPNFYNKVHFPLFNIDEAYIKYYNDNSIAEYFSYLQADDIIKIFKNLILEVPILVFCNDKQILTGFIENFLGLLSPFNYILPTISILPNKFYGIINAEQKFFFGINQNYNSNFFEENNIDIDKNMIIVNIDTINKSECRVEPILKKNDEEINYLVINSNNFNQNSNLIKNKNNNDFVTNDYVMYNGHKIDLINDIDLPQTSKKKLSNKLSSCFIGYKKKSKKQSNDDEINYKIQYNFFKFFVNILSGYTDYFLNSKFFSGALKTKNCGDNIRYKSNNNQSDINFLIENFNLDECVKQISKDEQPFYYAFFNTKMFINFLREKIYFYNKQNSLAFTQFDQLIYLKKHEDMRKAKENKGFFEDFKEGKIDKPKQEKLLDIVVKNNINFTPNELIQIFKIENKTSEILAKYAQLVKFPENKDDININNLKIKYCLFPKLLYNDTFFQNNYETLFFSHSIDLPNNKYLEEYKKVSKVKENTYISSRKYAFIPSIISKLPLTNNSKANFEIAAYYYIEFNWFILICCSLKYCEPIEREIRLNKVFEILDKLDYIEEQVLNLLYMTFLKYGNKTQCIKMREKIQKFIGHSNYLFLSLLCIKLNEAEKEDESSNLINNQKNKYFLKQRSIISSCDNFFTSRIKNENNETTQDSNLKIDIPNTSSNISYKETIIFSPEQFCEKCNCYNKFAFYEIMDGTIYETKINYNYKCPQCQSPIKDIIIRYQILLINKEKNETFISKAGEFKLLSAYRLYSELKYYLITRKDYSLDIDKIFNEPQINLLNFIFYFSQKNLPFDFLIPYKKNNDFENLKNNLGNIVNEINNKRFKELKKITKDVVNKKLNEEYKGEFVPINVSDGHIVKKFENLKPCLNVKTKDGENEGEKNSIGNCCICINGKE